MLRPQSIPDQLLAFLAAFQQSTLISTSWLQANANKAVIAQLEGMPGFRFAQVLGELHCGPRCPSLNMTAVMNWAPTFIDPLGQAVSSPLHDNSQDNKGLILTAFFFFFGHYGNSND